MVVVVGEVVVVVAAAGDAIKNTGSLVNVIVAVPSATAEPTAVRPCDVTIYIVSPALIAGLETVNVIGDVAAGDVPSGAFHDIANATTYVMVVGTCETNDEVSVTGYKLTAVPDGNAPAGMVTEAVLPAKLNVEVATAVDEAATDTGVPSEVETIPGGGGAAVTAMVVVVVEVVVVGDVAVVVVVAAATEIDSALVTDWLFASVIATVNDWLPDEVGVPLIVPPLESVKLAGSEPEESDHV